MSPRLLRYFELARKISRRSPSHHKLGCVIVNKNRVISVGFNNMSKTHPRSNSPFKTLHAEMDAIIGLNYVDTSGCDAFVFREYKDGRNAMAKPCPACETALRRAGIKNVYFSTDNGWSAVKL